MAIKHRPELEQYMNVDPFEIDKELGETLRLMEEVNRGTFHQQFEDIIEFITDLYLRDTKPFILTYSGGKDSSLVLALVFEAIRRLPKKARQKVIHIVSSDTKVETRKMTQYLLKNLELIKECSDEYNLRVHLVQPSVQQSFFYNVIGKGMVAPKPPSPFQWCTERMKILPMDNIVKSILIEQRKGDCDIESLHDAYMFVGSRLDESARRAANIKKLASDEGELFGINPTFKEIKMVYPIKFVATTDLWTYLMSNERLPWGLLSQELFDMYSSGEECPIMARDLKATKGCGSTNSRNGCWTCLYAGAKDKMGRQMMSA